jgi:DNA-binding MarR family transcriptional regulator
MAKAAPIPASIQQTIALVTHLISDLEASAFQQAGFSEVSMRQVLYLETIFRLQHPSFGELAQALGVTRPSVTASVGRLIQAGYVQKVQDDEDRRSFHILLTPKGQQFAHLHENMHKQVAQRLIAQLNPAEVEQLATLLNKAVGTS